MADGRWARNRQGLVSVAKAAGDATRGLGRTMAQTSGMSLRWQGERGRESDVGEDQDRKPKHDGMPDGGVHTRQVHRSS